MLNSWLEFPHAQVPVVRARCEDVVRRAYGRTIEVGCNEGFLAKALMEKGLEVVAVDCNPEAIKKAKDFFGIDAILAQGETLPFADCEFDTAIGAEILEHVENPGKLLAELFRVSKGHVILTLPIGDYWLGEVTHLWGIDGAVVNHLERDASFDCDGATKPLEKHVFVIEFDRRRKSYYDSVLEKKS